MRPAAPAALLLALVVLAAAGCGGSKQLKPASPLPIVVLDAPSTGNWVRLLRSGGWAVRAGTLRSILGRTGGVVPSDAQLSDDDVKALAAWVSDGGRLVTANSALLQKLGIGRDTGRRLKGVQGARWGHTLAVEPLRGNGLTVMAKATPDGSTI